MRWRVPSTAPVENPVYKCGRCHNLFRQFPGAPAPTGTASAAGAPHSHAPGGDNLEFIFPDHAPEPPERPRLASAVAQVRRAASEEQGEAEHGEGRRRRAHNRKKEHREAECPQAKDREAKEREAVEPQEATLEPPRPVTPAIAPSSADAPRTQAAPADRRRPAREPESEAEPSARPGRREDAARSQEFDFSAETDDEPTETDDELIETDHELRDTDHELTETDDELRETDHELTGTDHEPIETDRELSETDDEPIEAEGDLTEAEGDTAEPREEWRAGIGAPEDADGLGGRPRDAREPLEPFSDLDDEDLASDDEDEPLPRAPERVLHVEHAMQTPSAFGLMTRALAGMVALCGLLAVVIRAVPERAADWLAQVPVVGSAIARDRILTRKVVLRNVQGGYQRLRNARRVFVISGDAMNNSSSAIERIEIEGALYGMTGEIDQKVVSAGNRTALSDLSESEIAFLQGLDPRTTLAPGESTSFLIVFLEPPRDLREFSSRVLSVRATRRAWAPPPAERAPSRASVG